MSTLGQIGGLFSAPPEIKALAGTSKSLSFLDPKNVVDKAFPGNPLAPVKAQPDGTDGIYENARKKKAEAEAALDAQYKSTSTGTPSPSYSLSGALTKGSIVPAMKTKLG